MDTLKIVDETKKNAIIVKVIGEINPDTESDFKNYIEDLILSLDKDRKNVIFIFEELEYINSTGLGILANFYRVYQEDDVKVIIASLSPMCERLFEITKLNQVFITTNSLEEALVELES